MAQKIKILAAVLKRARNIKLIAMDVDGVLTAGDVIVLKSGEEVKLWNAKDRFAIAVCRDLKIPISFAWITGRQSENVAWSAKDLGVADLVQGCKDKKNALAEILTRRGISFEETAFIGDDLIDLPALQASGLSACPADAVPDVVSSVDYVSPLSGGRGCARDLIELVLKAQKKWDLVLEHFSA